MTVSEIFGTSYNEALSHNYCEGIGRSARKKKKAQRRREKQGRRNSRK